MPDDIEQNKTASQQSEAIGKKKEKDASLWQQMKAQASEDDAVPSRRNLSLRKIIGGEILTTEVVRRQIWLILLITLFLVVFIAQGYSYKKYLVEIDNLNTQLRDAKYKALSAESDLTEYTRESKIIELLKANHDSLLKRSTQPPFVIPVPKK